MLTRFAVLLSLGIFANTANAASAKNCDFSNLNFGLNQENLKNRFKLDTPDVSATGESTIVSGAPMVCADLPETAVVEFVLVDDAFVQMRIINENKSSALLAFATGIFGERDNVETDPKKIKPNEIIKLGLWAKDDAYSVVYSVYTAGDRSLEKLLVTSKKHKDLFTKTNQAKVKAADDELRANNLGKYAPDSTDKPVDADVISDETNTVKDLNKDSKLKENEHGRGSHYE